MWNEEGDRQDDIFVIEFLLLKNIKKLSLVCDEGVMREILPQLLFIILQLFFFPSNKYKHL